MLKDDLAEIFERDITKIITELNSYKKEEKIWAVKGDIKNSAGNLCLHLTGNLKHLIGVVLGNLDFKRDRDAEFSSEDIPREKMVKDLEDTVKIVSDTLRNLNDGDLAKEYPVEVFRRRMSTSHLMIHLAAHLNYHLGQINYHRRLIDP